jgi:hypothetical protein
MMSSFPTVHGVSNHPPPLATLQAKLGTPAISDHGYDEKRRREPTAHSHALGNGNDGGFRSDQEACNPDVQAVRRTAQKSLEAEQATR